MIAGKKYLLLWIILFAFAAWAFTPIQYYIQYFVPFLTGMILFILYSSVVVHELCHGLASRYCGDLTAEKLGRLTLNPIRHMSLIGSVLLPIILHLMHAPFVIGWAKPIPFNPTKLKEYPRDLVLVAAAGPISNFILALLFFNLYLIAGLVFKSINPDIVINFYENLHNPLGYNPGLVSIPYWSGVFLLLQIGIFVNVLLGVFNLIPIPPLDGFHILKSCLPDKLRIKAGNLQVFGIVFLIIMVYFNLLEHLFYPVRIFQAYFKSIAQLVLG